MSNFKVGKLKSGNFAVKSEIQYAHIMKADTKFDSEGVYHLTHLISEEDKDAVEALLMPIAQACFDEECKAKPVLKKQGSVVSPVKEIYDDEGEVVGYKLTIKQKRWITTKTGDKFEKFVKVIDGKGQPLDKTLLVGNGSVVASSFEPIPYFSAKDTEASVTLRLKSCKVLEFVAYDGADEFGEEFESDFDASGMKGTPQAQPEDDDEFGDEPPFEMDEDGNDDYS